MGMLLRSSFRRLRISPGHFIAPRASQILDVHNTIQQVPVRQFSAEQSPPGPAPAPESSTTTGPGSGLEPGPEASSPQPQPVISRSTPNLEYPVSKSALHNDLPSFLKYAERVELNKSSTVFVGTHFEYTVQSTLSLYGFSLQRVGGVSDAGIDLLGTWSIPSSTSSTPEQLRVIIQCKVTPNPRPHLIRELEGAFIGAPQGWRTSSSNKVLGFLILDKPATKGIREALGRSRWPMGFIYCSKEGIVEQFLWNERALSQGLEGLGVVRRYATQGQQVALTLNGRTLPYVGQRTTGTDNTSE